MAEYLSKKTSAETGSHLSCLVAGRKNPRRHRLGVFFDPAKTGKTGKNKLFRPENPSVQSRKSRGVGRTGICFFPMSNMGVFPASRAYGTFLPYDSLIF
jgi:hypothetical protein